MTDELVADGDHARPRENRAAARLLPLVTLLILTCFLAGTSADADLWGHLTFGRDIVGSHAVHATDPYSFTSDRPWVNHEWLAEAIMWIFYAVGGSAGLVVLKLSLAWAAGALLLDAWRRSQPTPIQRDALLFATVLGAWPSLVTARPQMFSLLFFAALLSVLTRVRDGQVKLLALVPVIFAVWVNVHGGWLVGAGVLGVFTACAMFDRALSMSHRRLVVAASIASAIATLCNPYGFRMLGFLFETVRPDRADIVEWLPVTKLPLVAVMLWLVPTAVAIAAVWRGRWRIPVSSMAIIVMLAIASFRVVRIVPFYALAAGFLAGPYIWSRMLVAQAPPRRTFRERQFAVLACLSIIAVSVAIFGRRIMMDGSWLPEPEAAAYVTRHRLQGHMFIWFDYGEYAIWHFWPAIRVSLDGRRETALSDELRAVHRRIYSDAPGAIEELRRLNPDYVWVPVDMPLVRRLETAGWQTVFRGPRSIIFARAGAPLVAEQVASNVIPAPRAFPGP